jgi:hypothetical protein
MSRFSDATLARQATSLDASSHLGVLIEHRVDDVDERVIAVDESAPAAQNVTLQPPFNGVLAEHLHDAPSASSVRLKVRTNSGVKVLVGQSTGCP